MMTINLKGWLTLVIFLSRRTLVNKKIFIVVAFALLLSSIVTYFTFAEETTPGIEDVADLLDIFVMTFFLLFIPMIYGSSILRSDLECSCTFSLNIRGRPTLLTPSMRALLDSFAT